MKNLTTLSVTCTFCKVEHFLPVTDKQITRYMNGSSVQDAFPQLDATQRELIISKTCGSCWDRLFGEEDEPEDDYDVDDATGEKIYSNPSVNPRKEQ